MYLLYFTGSIEKLWIVETASLQHILYVQIFFKILFSLKQCASNSFLKQNKDVQAEDGLVGLSVLSPFIFYCWKKQVISLVTVSYHKFILDRLAYLWHLPIILSGIKSNRPEIRRLPIFIYLNMKFVCSYFFI